MYFYACENDKHKSRHLGIDPILDTIIMTAALRAFSVEHHGEQLQCIAKSWATINGTAYSPQDEYERFKEHYNLGLADLYNHNHNAPNAANNQAHSMVDALAEHNDWLYDLESHWNATASIGERTCAKPQYGALDSGATDHFVPSTYHGTNHQDTTKGVTVGCANGSTMQA